MAAQFVTSRANNCTFSIGSSRRAGVMCLASLLAISCMATASAHAAATTNHMGRPNPELTLSATSASLNDVLPAIHNGIRKTDGSTVELVRGYRRYPPGAYGPYSRSNGYGYYRGYYPRYNYGYYPRNYGYYPRNFGYYPRYYAPLYAGSPYYSPYSASVYQFYSGFYYTPPYYAVPYGTWYGGYGPRAYFYNAW